MRNDTHLAAANLAELLLGRPMLEAQRLRQTATAHILLDAVTDLRILRAGLTQKA